jgi:hypothetical protein
MADLELEADPFGERVAMTHCRRLERLGARFRFETNSRAILALVDAAFGGLPSHTLGARPPELGMRLLLRPAATTQRRARPPAPTMLSGGGLLVGAPDASPFAVMSPDGRDALLSIPERMLRFPYETRYEYIEFAAFTLAARVQGLASLHAACIGRGGHAVLLMGASGAGKSTVTLQSLIAGFDMIAEDSVFVAPQTLRATGLANFLHLRPESLRWIARTRDATWLRRAPRIRRRSGVEKLEFDLRLGPYRLAPAPMTLAAIVLLSARRRPGRARLAPLAWRAFLPRLRAAQGYAASRPEWPAFVRAAQALPAFELERGAHPLESVEALDSLLMALPSRT